VCPLFPGTLPSRAAVLPFPSGAGELPNDHSLVRGFFLIFRAAEVTLAKLGPLSVIFSPSSSRSPFGTKKACWYLARGYDVTMEVSGFGR